MELKPELIFKAGLLIVFGALAAKIGASYFSHFMDRLSGAHKNPPDLDALIESKKHMIRLGEYGGNNQEPPPLPAGALSPKAEDGLKALLKSPALGEAQKEEIKKILNLFEESTWGGGASFEKMRAQFSGLTRLNLEASFFMRAFRFINARHLLKDAKVYSQVENLVLCAAFLHKLFSECQERQGQLINLLSSKEKVAPFHILRGAELIYLRQSKQSDIHLYAFLLQTKAESVSELSRLSQDEKDRVLEKVLKQPLVTVREFIKKIAEEAQLFASLTPVPQLNSSKDLAGAYAILGLSEKSSEEEIKKRYRQLAMERHPDRIAGKNIPRQYQEVAHKNFTLIHQALDIITAGRKINV